MREERKERTNDSRVFFSKNEEKKRNSKTVSFSPLPSCSGRARRPRRPWPKPPRAPARRPWRSCLFFWSCFGGRKERKSSSERKREKEKPLSWGKKKLFFSLTKPDDQHPLPGKPRAGPLPGVELRRVQHLAQEFRFGSVGFGFHRFASERRDLGLVVEPAVAKDDVFGFEAV